MSLELNGNIHYEVAVNYGRHKLGLESDVQWTHLEILDRYGRLWDRLIEASRNATFDEVGEEDEPENDIYAESETLKMLEKNKKLILDTLAAGGTLIWVGFDAGQIIFPFNEGLAWLEPLKSQVQGLALEDSTGGAV